MGSPDTGAREPQRVSALLAALAQIRQESTYRGPDRLRHIAREAMEADARALAAGVGVPPDGSEPFVAQSAKSADVRGLRAKIRAHVERLLPHGDDCDEGWTQGVCGRCDLLAAMEVSFGFALPLGADAVDRVIEAACALRFTDWRSEVRAAEVNTELWHDLVDAVDALTASEASAAEGRKPKPDAGVGVARPAEPPQEFESLDSAASPRGREEA